MQFIKVHKFNFAFYFAFYFILCETNFNYKFVIFPIKNLKTFTFCIFSFVCTASSYFSLNFIIVSPREDLDYATNLIQNGKKIRHKHLYLLIVLA